MAASLRLPWRVGRSSNGLSSSLDNVAQLCFNPGRISALQFSTSARLQMKGKGRRAKRVRFDPYHAAQAAQLKAANLARQEVLKKERAAALGDPVRSQQTPFIQSLRETGSSIGTTLGQENEARNFYLDSKEITESLDNSQFLSEPLSSTLQRYEADRETPMLPDHVKQVWEQRQTDWKESDARARVAVDRITSLNMASSADRTRVNIQKCIEEFGRHNTDTSLPPRPQGPAQLATSAPEQPRLRGGPDTGSSEVQVAILTSKIDKLADLVAKFGHKDKHNKRNLRLLVHRRQKLLAYLRRRERGGPRWANVMEKLGLSDGAWKGEISM